jgi:hypothetical protein
MTGFPPGLGLADPTRTAVILLVIEVLFGLRVVGQAVVARWAPAGLPPMSEWYSGLIAYPYLLAIQVLILAVMTLVASGVAGGVQPLVDRQSAIGSGVLAIAWPYAMAMVVRYAVRMWRHPEARWTGRTIPIVFHVVLATWLFVLGSYLRTTG